MNTESIQQECRFPMTNRRATVLEFRLFWGHIEAEEPRLGEPRARMAKASSIRAVGPRSQTFDKLVESLHPYLSTITAESVTMWACLACGVEPVSLEPSDITALDELLRKSLSIYLGPHDIEKAMASIRSQDTGHPNSIRLQRNACTIHTEHDILVARNGAKQLGKTIGFDVFDTVKIATVVSELARNMYQYAGGGAIEAQEIMDPKHGLEIVAFDSGPGIPNLDEILTTNYRSKTGMGLGLKGSSRLMDTFDIASTTGKGTTITARKFLPSSKRPA